MVLILDGNSENEICDLICLRHCSDQQQSEILFFFRKDLPSSPHAQLILRYHLVQVPRVPVEETMDNSPTEYLLNLE